MTGLFRRGRKHESQRLQPSTEEIMETFRDPLPSGPLEWGIPTRCPMCDNWGYIDRLDLVDRVMQLHCPSCMFHWEISEEQIDNLKQHRESDSESDAVNS